MIGLTYGWQLAEAGHDVTVLVRSDKLPAAESGGFDIHYTDERRLGVAMPRLESFEPYFRQVQLA